MSARTPAKDQPKDFAFNKANSTLVKAILKKYPKGREQSAVIPLLDLAQRQMGEETGTAGWVSIAAMNTIADTLDIPYIRVYEVATFYTMFNLAPVGEHFVQVCRTTPCWLRGSDALTQSCLKKAGTSALGETSKDGKFTVVEVECLGACVNAPMVQVNDDYYEDLDADSMEALMDKLAAGKKPPIGTQIDRQNSAPHGELTSLKKRAGKGK